MDCELFFNSDYIRAADLKGKDVNLTITAVSVTQFDEADAKTKKGVLAFKETDKKLGINRTNQVCLKAMFGRETDAWVGKQLTIYPTEVYMPQTGANEPCVRIKGSPDLAKDLTIKIKLPKKKAVELHLKKTEKK